MRKTYNLTKDNTQNDPIDLRIKGFSWCNFEDERWYWRGEFSLFFWQNLTFNQSLDEGLSLEDKEGERFKDLDV